MLKIQLCITEINYKLYILHFLCFYIIKIYIKIKTVTLNCKIISQYYSFYCIFDQTNAALVKFISFKKKKTSS